MPPDAVLTAASTITCAPGHLGAGRVTLTPVPLLSVDGSGVLTSGNPSGTVAGCTQPTSAPPAPPSAPCASAVVGGGSASLLVVDGSPVLLESTFSATTTTGLPPPTYRATAGQTLLRAE